MSEQGQGHSQAVTLPKSSASPWLLLQGSFWSAARVGPELLMVSRNGAKSFLPVTAATFLNDEGGEQDLEAVLLLALDFPPGASAQHCCILLRAPLSREAARQRLCWLAGGPGSGG